MKNLELFNKSVGILVDAYRNDTLRHGDYCGCAVGNLIASNCGYKIITTNSSSFEWSFSSGILWYTTYTHLDEANKCKVKKQIESTGYLYEELMKIEKSFEKSDRGNNDDDWMFNGLLAVYDILCNIHEMDKEEVIKGELIFVK
jgi:hypothetical protein